MRSCLLFFAKQSTRKRDGDSELEGNIVIFSPPTALSRETMKFFRLPNAIIGGTQAHTVRNLIWKTKILPRVPRDSFCRSMLICERLQECENGYLVLNDESDGFRIFWIVLLPSPDIPVDITLRSLQSPQQKIVPQRRDIVIATDNRQAGTSFLDSMIEPLWAKASNGLISMEHGGRENVGGLEIVFEGYLKVDALLSDIIRRRKKMIFRNMDSVEIMPDYYYNMVSITEGRTAKLVIVFDNPGQTKVSNTRQTSGPASLGVFLTLDLLDQSYTENRWLQHPTCKGSGFLRQWSNKLATNERMIEMNVGPYCHSTTQTFFGIETHEIDVIDEDDENFSFWADYVSGKQKNSTALPPKSVAMSSLYPFCDLIKNDAVVSAIPVHQIHCKQFPLELYYR